MAIAIHNIRVFGPDGEPMTLVPGDEVDDYLTEEVIERMKEEGIVGDKPRSVEDVQSIENENAELRAQLAELQAHLEELEDEDEDEDEGK